MYQTPTKISSADRFIPRRSDANLEASNYLLLEKQLSPEYSNYYVNSKYVNQAYLKWKQEIYRKRLWSVLVPKSQRVLNITETSQKSSSINAVKSQQWPVHPRKHPLISSPAMALDMPELEGDIRYNIMDWGSKGYLASIYEKEVYLWHAEARHVPYQATNTNNRIANCIRWNHSATYLAMALSHTHCIALWDFVNNQICQESCCLCPSPCTITCLTWSSNNLLISGCTLGRISISNLQLMILKTVSYAHNSLILTINLSCQERYLVTTSMDLSVRVWIWPDIKPCFEITHLSPIRGIAWHPWKDSLLAIGGSYGDGSLCLWNVSNSAQVAYKAPLSNQDSVDCLAWNKLTGELVVSYWRQQHNTSFDEYNSIVVLSDLDTEVDLIKCHTGRVPYLLWGMNNTKLATAGTDENLFIWDFFGNCKEITKNSTNNKRKFPTNNIETLSLFGRTIR